MAEMMAYVSLIKENFDVRLSGVYYRRGLFGEWNFIISDSNTGKPYNIFSNYLNQ